MSKQPVMLIGAGIGGLTCALALQRAGIAVKVYEQAPELGEVGAGLTLSPNGSKALMGLGLENELAELADPPSYQAVHHYQTGQVLVRRERGDLTTRQYGAPYYQIHRADLHDMLGNAVRANDPECIVLGHEFERFTQDANGVTAWFANGSSASGRVLVGCDGVKSPVRSQMHEQEAPKFTGYVAWRGLAPADKVPAEAVDPPSGTYIGPGHLFVRYLIRGGETVNYVAFVERDDWQVESWSQRSTVKEVLDEFSEFHGLVRAIIEATPPELCYKWGLFSRRPLESWSLGRVALLGDAAHPTLPFMGMGAVMAIEDGVVLARCMADSGSVSEAFRRYEAARVERTTLVMLESGEIIHRFFAPDTERFAERNTRNEESLGLFRYDAWQVPV
ncbi:MAG: NAD(P)-binding protein [Gammaproteobacteria bacterium]|nr:FAD-dependent monooxygenase [Gemmatimonadota bacterium]MXW45229.1 NAD(P)-binding protein [Gammaproteobacteria bacterium]MYD01145.1 NAD(P)-binding protein [Gammaproteobacteria bacterium]MYI24893.1 NAD(P)-binding protein [Gammaproteobacteria bacterium]